MSNAAATPLLGDDGQFAPSAPSARTILTYSESTNPRSPHHSDQTALFDQKRWVTDRFTANQITTDPQLQVTVVTSE